MPKSKRPKKAKIDVRDNPIVTILANLHKRIYELEKRLTPIETTVSVLKLDPKDMLVFTTSKPLASDAQQKLTNEMGQQFGRKVACLFMSEGSKVEVMKKRK